MFQVGSVTKPWTDFRVADQRASAEFTVRQLTGHLAGFEGDVFTDTGRGDDAIEKYLATITGLPQLSRPGKQFSYNNAGYVVLGRIIEVLRGKPYAAALRDRLFVPLGLSHAATGAYEAILHRAAVGHVQSRPGADPQPARTWAKPAWRWRC